MRRTPQRAGLLFTVWLLAGVGSAGADRVLVAVASNFAPAMGAVAKSFEESSGHEVDLSVASSGSLFAQIDNGAPFEVFLSADVDRPRRLEQAGLAVGGSRFTYAIGRLAAWAPSEGSADPGPLTWVRAVAAFEDEAVRHVALADPDTAPYGRAARATLQRLGLWDRLEGRLARAESVAQTYQFVATGAAEIGLVALSQLVEVARTAEWCEVPAELHPPIEQQAVLLLPGRGRSAALAFVEYLGGEVARGIIRDFGYEVAPR